MSIDLVIFDCDGVIADSEILSAEVLIDELAKAGLAVTMEDVLRDFLGRSFPSVAGIIRERFGRALPDGFEAAYRDNLLARFETDLTSTPDFPTMLSGLRLPFCVATSSAPPRVARTLELLGLSDRFGPHVFTASQVARGKPAPDLFLLAAERMGASPANCLVIEDSDAGIMAAKAAGMPVLHYTGGSHLRGREIADREVLRFDDWLEFPKFLAPAAG